VYRRVLIVGVDTLTRYIDYTDRGTCILFGDGAGAVVLETTDSPRGLVSTVLGADGAGHKHLYVPKAAKLAPDSAELLSEVSPYMKMNGREVFRFAVQVMGDSAAEAVQKADLTFRNIDMLIPHQANLRIIDAAARRFDLPREKVWVNVDRYGNTSAASVPIALCEAAEAGALAEGNNVVLVAFGAGLAWAAGVVRWGIEGTSTARSA
jgi:3-oxoacyl-[acyl-carrier-protein] synthase-3